MSKPWRKIASRLLGDYSVFRLRSDKSLSPLTGREHEFVVLESNDWINVIPMTSAGRVVLIRQYRHGIEDITLEIPGGLVDSHEANPRQAAERELLEETGYRAGRLLSIGVVHPNPAILDNRCHSYLALEAWRAQEPEFDGSEDIQVEECALEEVPGLIRSGRISHALTIAAFYFLDDLRRTKPELLDRHEAE